MDNKSSQPKPTYLLQKTIEPNAKVRKKLIKLFTTYPSRKYSTQKDIGLAMQKDIGLAMQKEFGTCHSQSGISKRLQELSDRPFKVKGIQYVISKYNNEYQLLNVSDYRNSLRHKLKEAAVFTKEIVYYEHGLEHPQTFVFWVSNDTKKQNMALESFKSMLEDIYLDIFLYQDKLIIMLNPDSPSCGKYSDVLKNFFDPYYDIFKKAK